MSRFGTILSIILCAASICRAEVASIPDWLPEDQRFEVSGTSNEIAQASHTLAVMRDMLHPKMLAKMCAAEQGGDDAGSSCAMTNGCPALMGLTLQWIVHMSLPAATNEAAYFESYKNPLSAAAFGDVALLTNRAARLSYLPPVAKLSLVFNDHKRRYVISRAIPGVDYPGVEFEDAGSTAYSMRLRLCAPKSFRTFWIRADSLDVFGPNCEFKWIESQGGSWRPKPTTQKPSNTDRRVIHVERRSVSPTRQRKVFIFVRQAGGLWGPPSRAVIGPAQFGTWKYYQSGLLESIDYGTFRDVYSYGEKDVVIGFTRYLPGMMHGDAYSKVGEKIIDGYSDDRPKTTRKVMYSVKDGKLSYTEDDKVIYHKNEVIEDRSSKW